MSATSVMIAANRIHFSGDLPAMDSGATFSKSSVPGRVMIKELNSISIRQVPELLFYNLILFCDNIVNAHPHKIDARW